MRTDTDASCRPGSDRPTRRRLILGGIAGVAGAVLGGCSGGEDDGRTTASADATTTSTTSATTAETTVTAETTSTPSVPTLRGPDRARRDEIIDLRIADLPPETRVTVEAETSDAGDNRWSGTGTYVTDGDGVARVVGPDGIDAADPESLAAMAPMGLVWSMDSATGPLFWAPATGSWDLTVTVRSVGGRERSEDISTTVTVRNAPDVEERSLDGDVRGFYFEPPGDGPHPPVLVLHGSSGIPLDQTAALLASHGYAALALNYYRGDGFEPLREVPVENAVRGIDWLLDREAVASEGVGVYGSSKGAELSLLLATVDDRVDAVVSRSPSAFVFQGGNLEDPVSSWTLDGEPLPYVPFPEDLTSRQAEYRGWRSVYEEAVDRASDERLARARIPVEEGDTPYLLTSGTDDGVWPSTPFGEAVVSRLEDRDYEHPFDHYAAEGGRHVLPIPYVPATASNRVRQYAGGSARGDATGGETAWTATLSLLAEHVAGSG